MLPADQREKETTTTGVPTNNSILTPTLSPVTPPSRYPYRCPLITKKGCLSASAGVNLLSGLSVRHRSSRSTKWFSSLLSASSMPADAARRRVRRSRVGLTLARARMFVCDGEGKAS